MSWRRRVYCETLPLEELAKPATLELLFKYGVSPILAVRPHDPLDVVARVLGAAKNVGMLVELWPMVANEDGRWLNARNAHVFEAFVGGVVDELARERGLSFDLALDLEPPFDVVRAVMGGGAAPGSLASDAPIRDARRAVRRVVERAAGTCKATALVSLPVLFDPPDRDAWQGALGTPVDGIPWASMTTMLYSSMFEGFLGSVIDREIARGLLAMFARATRERFTHRASVSLGVVAPGALGDERSYTSVDELADDVGIARAAGVEDLVLFDLGGVLARGGSVSGAERWLDAFRSAPAAPRSPRPSLAARVAFQALRRAGPRAARFLVGNAHRVHAT